MEAVRTDQVDLNHCGQDQSGDIGSTPAPSRAQGVLKVWIDQDLCTGDGLCTDHAPAVFTILEDGIAYVREGDVVLNDPGGAATPAIVPPAWETRVIEAAADCPGECIFVEIDDVHELPGSVS